MVLAHAGHWAASLIYFSPVVIVGGGIAITTWRDNRQSEEGDHAAEGGPDDV